MREALRHRRRRAAGSGDDITPIFYHVKSPNPAWLDPNVTQIGASCGCGCNATFHVRADNSRPLDEAGRRKLRELVALVVGQRGASPGAAGSGGSGDANTAGGDDDDDASNAEALGQACEQHTAGTGELLPLDQALTSFFRWCMARARERAGSANAPASRVLLISHNGALYAHQVLAKACAARGVHMPAVALGDSVLVAKSLLGWHTGCGMDALIERYVPERQAIRGNMLEDAVSVRMVMERMSGMWLQETLSMSTPLKQYLQRCGFHKLPVIDTSW